MPLAARTAAWSWLGRPPGLDKLGKISPAFFGYDRVLRVPPVYLEHRDDGYLP